MEPVKEAFKKVKEDIDYLYQELEDIKKLLQELKNQQTNQPTNQHKIQSVNLVPTNTPTHIPTHNLPLEALKPQNFNISTGNQGVPTNQPTNQQTNQHPFISTDKFALNRTVPTQEDRITHLQKVSAILESLDSLKKEVRFKFKKLTEQEMVVYSAIYQLEEQGILVDYSILAEKLSLSEISIRDYIRKVINKGIPLDKIRENNKRVILKIPLDLKKIASLNTIMQLRNL